MLDIYVTLIICTCTNEVEDQQKMYFCLSMSMMCALVLVHDLAWGIQYY